MTLLDVSLNCRHAQLWLELEALDKLVKEKAAELARVARLCADTMVDAGVLSLPFEYEGKQRTHYLHTSLSVRRIGEVDSETAIAALYASGLDWIVRPSYPAQTLTSWAREELANERALPSAFELAFYVHHEDELRLKGGTKKRSASAKAAAFYRRQAARSIEEARRKADHE